MTQIFISQTISPGIVILDDYRFGKIGKKSQILSQETCSY